MKQASNFTFPAIVNGQSMSATVVSEEGEDRDFYYRVKFSDHYEDVFHDEENRLVGLRGEGSDPYADAIKYDVGLHIGWDPEMFWEVFSEVVEGEKLNVWVFEGEEEDEEENVYTTYNVHVKGAYRFHLMKVADSWMISNRNEESLSDSDKMLAEKVEDLLIALL